MKVMEFQGNSKAGAKPAPPVTLPPVAEPDLVPSPDVPLAILKRKLMATNDIAAARGYLMEINAHLKVFEMDIINSYNNRCIILYRERHNVWDRDFFFWNCTPRF